LTRTGGINIIADDAVSLDPAQSSARKQPDPGGNTDEIARNTAGANFSESLIH
jgi:hypothetical protein